MAPFFGTALSEDEVACLKILIYIMTVSTTIAFISSVFSSAILAYERYLFDQINNIFLTIGMPIMIFTILLLRYGNIVMAIGGVCLSFFMVQIYILYIVKQLKLIPKFIRLFTAYQYMQ